MWGDLATLGIPVAAVIAVAWVTRRHRRMERAQAAVTVTPDSQPLVPPDSRPLSTPFSAAERDALLDLEAAWLMETPADLEAHEESIVEQLRDDVADGWPW